ncbi:MAG: DUF2268 domain-containing putative Zn-dependent protease [Bacteroidota bacterium]
MESEISILYTPITGILFGGCANDQFCLELNYVDQDIEYTIEKGIPHELNHLVYEPLHINDPNRGTALRQVIDEGLACFFTWLFFDKNISPAEAVENMTKEEWTWYLSNEKQIFEQTFEYFDDVSGDNPLLRNDRYKVFPLAPKTLYYWLGFRIIQKYVERNGPESWRDVYELDIAVVLEKSGYREYIAQLE